jgi:hypothetical protein
VAYLEIGKNWVYESGWENIVRGLSRFRGVQSCELQVYFSITAGVASMQSELLREIYLSVLSWGEKNNKLLVFPSVISFPLSNGHCTSASKLINRKVYSLAQMKSKVARQLDLRRILYFKERSCQKKLDTTRWFKTRSPESVIF